MARKGRLAMELISNKRARLISMEKRKKSLKKSAHDLSTLCGVEIGVVIVSDQHSEVWPNLDTLHKLLPLQQDERRRYGVLDYFREKREEVEGEMKKMRRSKYSTEWGKEFESFSHHQLTELDCFLKAKIGAVRETINSHRALASSRNPEEEQILGCNYISPCLSTEFFMNPYLQESGFYCEGQSNNPYLNMNSEFAMNPYLEESMLQQHHHQQMAEINNVGNLQSEMVMMNSHGASYNFHQSQEDDYGHLLEENWFQKEMVGMENFGTNDVEPLMSYDMLPDGELMMLQNWQGLLPFPEEHYV